MLPLADWILSHIFSRHQLIHLHTRALCANDQNRQSILRLALGSGAPVPGPAADGPFDVKCLVGESCPAKATAKMFLAVWSATVRPLTEGLALLSPSVGVAYSRLWKTSTVYALEVSITFGNKLNWKGNLTPSILAIYSRFISFLLPSNHSIHAHFAHFSIFSRTK